MLRCYDLHIATSASGTERSQQHSAGACTSRCSKPSPPGWSVSSRSLLLFLSGCERNTVFLRLFVLFFFLFTLPCRLPLRSRSHKTAAAQSPPTSSPAATSDRQGEQLSCVNDAVVTVCRRGGAVRCGASWPAEEARKWKKWKWFWTLTHARWLGAGGHFSFLFHHRRVHICLWPLARWVHVLWTVLILYLHELLIFGGIHSSWKGKLLINPFIYNCRLITNYLIIFDFSW